MVILLLISCSSIAWARLWVYFTEWSSVEYVERWFIHQERFLFGVGLLFRVPPRHVIYPAALADTASLLILLYLSPHYFRHGIYIFSLTSAFFIGEESYRIFHQILADFGHNDIRLSCRRLKCSLSVYFDCLSITAYDIRYDCHFPSFYSPWQISRHLLHIAWVFEGSQSLMPSAIRRIMIAIGSNC